MNSGRGSSAVRVKLKVLVVEADEYSVESIQFVLKKSRMCDFELEWFANAESARAAFFHNNFDAYIVDHRLGDEDGIEFVRQVILEGCKRPIIVITGFDDTKDDMRALAAGAADYLSKDMLDSPFLERVVRHAIERANLQRKNLDQQAAHFQDFKLSMLGRMSACIAHEINNPLALIIGELFNLQVFLQKNEMKKEEMVAKIGRIEGYAGRVVKIIQSLSRGAQNSQASQTEKMPIRRLVLEAVDLCASKLKVHHVETKIFEDSSDVLIDCNPVEISCVLVNLLNNAIDAIKTLPERWIQIETANRENKIVLLVTDSGLGFAPEIREQIFSPFFSTKKDMDGLGLGLNLSQAIVEKYGGTLSVNSQSKNTQFQMTLPIKIDACSRSSKVLLVEDDVDFADFIAVELMNAGYEVKTAQNGLKALDLLKSKKFDVLIVDLVIPGIRGDDLVRQAAALSVLPTRVVGMTGFDQKALVPRLDTSEICVLQKPFVMLDLVRMIEMRVPDQELKAS